MNERRALRGQDVCSTDLHLAGGDVLVVVLHHVGEEGHVVGHAQAPVHLDGLAGERTVGVAAAPPGPRHGQAPPPPQRSGRLHGVDVYLYSR